jgi:hypothetical protein
MKSGEQHCRPPNSRIGESSITKVFNYIGTFSSYVFMFCSDTRFCCLPSNHTIFCLNAFLHLHCHTGLGTSTAAEGKAYFSDLARHRIALRWTPGDQDAQRIDLAFRRSRADHRKMWLLNFQPGMHTHLAFALRILRSHHDEFIVILIFLGFRDLFGSHGGEYFFF